MLNLRGALNSTCLQHQEELGGRNVYISSSSFLFSSVTRFPPTTTITYMFHCTRKKCKRSFRTWRKNTQRPKGTVNKVTEGHYFWAIVLSSNNNDACLVLLALKLAQSHPFEYYYILWEPKIAQTELVTLQKKRFLLHHLPCILIHCLHEESIHSEGSIEKKMHTERNTFA